MNRAWIIRAEQRLERLEKLAERLEAELAAVKLEKLADHLLTAEVKRGPGRPRKDELVQAG